MQNEPTALTFEAFAERGGNSARFRISISAPYDTKNGCWACLFELRGIKEAEERREYFGVDGLQALILNLYYLRSLFYRLLAEGYVFRDVESGEEFNPAEYFDAFKNKNEA